MQRPWSNDVFADGRAHANGIENFGRAAKSRLTKLRSIGKILPTLEENETAL
jgi:hypothetical protein